MRPTPSVVAGAAIVGLVVAVGVLAPVLAPHAVTSSDLSGIRPGVIPGPSPGHLLGLDPQGRDVLSRLLHGARWSLLVGVMSVALGTLAGVVVGTSAAVVGHRLESLIMRLVDVFLAVPGLLVAIAMAALLGPTHLSVIVAIALSQAPNVARLMRGVLVVERERDYVLAARAVGATRRRLVTTHLLPNSISPVVVGSMVAVGGAMLEAAGLAFLGLGPNDPARPDWGTMLAEGEAFLQSAPRLLLFPSLAILVTVVGFNLLGDGLRDTLDVKGVVTPGARAQRATTR